MRNGQECLRTNLVFERICSYEEILKREDIDAIYIAVINSLHYDLVKK